MEKLKISEYRKVLVLQYLNKTGRNYMVKEIFAMLGFEADVGLDLLEEMFNDGTIEYRDYLISITDKGRDCLKRIMDRDFKIYDGNILKHDVLPKLKKSDIYIPRSF